MLSRKELIIVIMAAAEVAYYTDEEMMLIDDDCIKSSPEEDKNIKEGETHPLLNPSVSLKFPTLHFEFNVRFIFDHRWKLFSIQKQKRLSYSIFDKFLIRYRLCQPS